MGKFEKMKPTNTDEDYYVYCYIDPRNLEIFYYGKGTGDRSESHLLAQGKSEMATRIKKIRASGVEPTIRIIAADLTEDQALIIEAALIWKSGKRQLANVASGHYQDKFRPKDTLHKKLSGFDFSHSIHFFNVGEFKGNIGRGMIVTRMDSYQRVSGWSIETMPNSFTRATSFSHI